MDNIKETAIGYGFSKSVDTYKEESSYITNCHIWLDNERKDTMFTELPNGTLIVKMDKVFIADMSELTLKNVTSTKPEILRINLFTLLGMWIKAWKV